MGGCFGGWGRRRAEAGQGAAQGRTAPEACACGVRPPTHLSALSLATRSPSSPTSAPPPLHAPQVIVDTYNLKVIDAANPEKDVADMMAGH